MKRFQLRAMISINVKWLPLKGMISTKMNGFQQKEYTFQ